MDAYPCFTDIRTKGNCFCDFLFGSLDDVVFPKRVLLTKERIYSHKMKLFPFRVDPPMGKGGKNKNGRVAPPECVSVCLKNTRAQLFKTLLA